MQSELLKMAEGFSLVAAALAAIAKDKESSSKEDQTAERVPEPARAQAKEKGGSEPEKGKGPNVGIEDIRAVLAEKSQDGKSKEVKVLLNQFGVAKLSAVAEKDYPGLLRKAKAL